MEWIKIFVPEFEIPSGMDAVHQALKDGVVLCKLMEALNDGKKVGFYESDLSFKHLENIGKFLDEAEKYGVDAVNLFQTIDLFEKLNMAGVISGLYALGRKAGSKGKPSIGPKESEKNVMTFTEDHLKAGANIIGLKK